MKKPKSIVTIELPEEFLEWCEYDMVKPETVLCGFIADLLGLNSKGYNSHGSTQKSAAEYYYDSVGYAFESEWIRKNLPHLVKQKDPRQAAEFKQSPIALQADDKHVYTSLTPIGRKPQSYRSQAANLNCRDRQFNLTPDSDRFITSIEWHLPYGAGGIDRVAVIEKRMQGIAALQ